MCEMNESALRVTLALIRFGGRGTRAEIQAHTGLSKPGVLDAIGELRGLRVIHNVNENMGYLQASEILRKKQGQSNGPGDEVCEWCECKTMVLHKHHYPIPARAGGTSTVSICPNCHAEYHALVDTAVYRLRPVDDWEG